MAVSRRLILGMGLLTVWLLVPLVHAQAAAVQSMSDLVSDHTKSVGSDHTFSFTSLDPVGIGDTMALTFNNNFDVSAVTSLDVAVVANNIALISGIDYTASVASSSVTITFAVGFLGGIPWEIKVGTHVTGGANQVINPDYSGSYRIDLGGTFGGTGFVYVPILDSNEVSVSAYVPSPEELAGQSGSGTTTGGYWAGSCVGVHCLDRVIFTDYETVLLSGFASPHAEVFIQSTGRIIAQFTADPDGVFQIGLDTNLIEGGEITMYAVDTQDRRTPDFILTVLQPVSGAVLYYENIMLAPTIEGSVEPGSEVGYVATLYGQTVPGASVVVTHNETSVLYTIADDDGKYSLRVNLDDSYAVLYAVAVHPETHRTSAASNKLIVRSDDLGRVIFEEYVDLGELECVQRGDITGDGEVTLADMAFAALHRGRLAFFNIAIRKREQTCLNDDARIDLADMSIIGFYLSIL